jgi:hypothetical protein
MELVRDLLRDLVGVIFPGGLFVTLTLCFLFGILIVLTPFNAPDAFSLADSPVGCFVLLILSYIAGQSLRMKQLNDLEKACAETYRKKRKKDRPELSDEEFKASIKEIDEKEQDYYAGELTLDELTEAYRQHIGRFGIWEQFPYPYHMKGRRLLRHSRDYNQFFEKYDRQGVTKHKRFFNFCKSVIYEYSPSFKEEVLRQEALVRLFAGIYYVIKYGKIIGAITGLLHLTVLASFYITGVSFPPDANIALSWRIVLVSAFALVAFWYLNREILNRLRFRRVKELHLAYDGFYLICNEHDLDFE